MTRRNTPEDFWAKVNVGFPDDCWPYTGRLKPPRKNMPIGHGMYDHDGTWDYAHRYAFFLTYGHFPLVGRHTCDNPPCCNPTHILDGTQGDNIRDRDERDRRHPAQGENAPVAKLTAAQVAEIRSTYVKYSRGATSLKGLAEKYGVHLTTIHLVVTGRTFR